MSEQNSEQKKVVVVGGGQAGTATSYFLQRLGISHVVLEKEYAFSEWHKRWDSFHMNTANWMNMLPGATSEFAPGTDRDGLGTIEDALRYFQAYLSAVEPPLQERTEVTSVRQGENDIWRVVTSGSVFETTNVVICTGAFSHPRFPPVASRLPASVPQLHSHEYRNPSQIEGRHTLVVGSGNSGVQICHDLAKSQRFDALTLSTSGNMTFPLRILGIPIYTYARWLGLLDLKAHSWLGRRLVGAGKGDPTIPPSPKQLARDYGVDLVGKVMRLENDGIRCSDGRLVSVEGLNVIWCTGFDPNHDFINPVDRHAAFGADGQPVHQRGVVPAAPGLYFVGLRDQYRVSSQDIYGVGRDARFIVQQIANRLSHIR